MSCQPLKTEEHKKEIMAVQDSMDVLNGKWKISIISSICYYNKRRFSDILNDVVGISNKMLSKELKELEINKLIKRIVLNTQPITVQYELTSHGKSLQTIINNLRDWGMKHRKEIIGNTSPNDSEHELEKIIEKEM
ncbi:HxlR family transcriptional regulator [Chryseobacterium sp. Leaf405]|uniref:winged helix-turn-helix transcriptional regulator n=1 Tax=Chryseobacterium sp. Leaf405 TaxID=1736367 RepID=UPI0006F92720|nr:helix-turn-helix domain-containing protein [Chryseobacterium sp. Leaf405]KQT24435.1 HxlR family transcriptional regulator [Chryseobacterium sp. Leaf405]